MPSFAVDRPRLIAVAAGTSNRVDARLGLCGAELSTLGEGFQGGAMATPAAGWMTALPVRSSGIEQAGGVPDVITPATSGSCAARTGDV